MAAARILLGIICLAVVNSRTLPERSTVTLRPLHFAAAELGVRESGAPNDGPRVRAYLLAADIRVPSAWCAAFVSWCFRQAGHPLPRTGWSPALFPESRIRLLPASGLVFGIYFPKLGRIGHCGFVERVQGDWIITIEGNTNQAGSREGDGVYRKWRHRRSVHRFADWESPAP